MKKRKMMALVMAFSMLLGQTAYAQEYTVQTDQTELSESIETEADETVMEETAETETIETDVYEPEETEPMETETHVETETEDKETDSAIAQDEIPLLQNGDMVSQYFCTEDQNLIAMFSADEDASAWKSTLKEKIREGIQNLNSEIQTDDLGIYYSTENMDEIGNVLQETINEGYFYIDNYFSVSYYTQSKLIAHIYINYKADYQDSSGQPDEELIRKDEALVNVQIDRALKSVQNADSDLEKALLLHDFVVRECDYDYQGAYGGEDASLHPHMYDIYGTFVLGSAVCSGYASAYSVLLQKCGIESYVVTSDAMNHAWNLVEIDGHWYHIDTTWDDPVFTNGQTWRGLTNTDTADEGFINHTYFMCSDAEIKALDHEGWDEVETADQSGAYEDYLFKTTPRSSFAKIGAKWYMFNLASGSLYASDSLLSADAVGLTANNSANYGWGYEDNFYTNTENSVYKWNVQTGKNEMVWETSDEQQKISEMSIKNGYLICVILDPDGTTVRVETDIQDLNETYLQQGTCGSHLVWHLDAEGVLTISGSGEMQAFTYKAEVPWYNCIEDVSAVVIEDGVTTIGDYAFYGMTNLEEVQIPKGVKTIGAYAFKNDTALEDVNLPSTLKKLGESAFYGCTGLSEVTIPEGMYTVWGYTFKNCTKLSKVTLPSTLIKLDEAAFYGCTSLKNLTIPDNVEIIGIYCFKNCSNLSEVKLPKKLKQIREAVFYGCNHLTVAVIPEKVESIGDYAFRKCEGLKTLSLPESVKTVGESAFYGCSNLSELTIPEGIIKLGDYAFKNCVAVKAVSLPETMETIGESTFYGCTGLTVIIIPSNVKKIGNYAFSRCSGLNEIDFTGDAPAIDSYSLSKVTADAKYPAGNTTWTADKRQNYGGQLIWTEK